MCSYYTTQLVQLSNSQEAIVLLSHRYRFYKRYKNHYFFLDFCYYETLLVFIYLWLPCCNTFRAALFPVVFAFSHGPILGSVVLWRNSIVLHSVDKMTNIVLHVSPAVTLWGIRWWVGHYGSNTFLCYTRALNNAQWNPSIRTPPNFSIHLFLNTPFSQYTFSHPKYILLSNVHFNL